MKPQPPEYLLFAESLRHPAGDRLWRFLLLRTGTDESVSASDIEPDATSSRAELLAVVRGLEAIDQPGNVKLITGSGYISRGLSRGLNQWRSQNWHWERFGRRVPVRDHDLWQRVDRALEFHTLRCHAWGKPSGAATEVSPAPRIVSTRVKKGRSRRERLTTATQQTVGAWGRQVGSLLTPSLSAVG